MGTVAVSSGQVGLEIIVGALPKGLVSRTPSTVVDHDLHRV
jgi:hypothetical protein